MEAQEEWLTVRQVADFTGMSTSSVRAMCIRQWEQQHLARKHFYKPDSQGEWLIRPAVLKDLEGRVSAAKMATEPEEKPAYLSIKCHVLVGGTRIDIYEDGSIFIETKS